MRSFALSGAALLTCALPLSAAAFEREVAESGAPLFWPKNTLDYDVAFDPSDDHYFSANTRRAFDTWGHGMRGHFVPNYLGPTAAAALDDGRTTVELATSFAFDNAETTVAHTFFAYDTISGRIIDADVVLNGEHFRFAADTPGAFDTESVILHELGHVLGLAHTCGNPRGEFPSCFSLPPSEADAILGAVMAPTLAALNQRRALTADDLAGLEVAYAVSSTRAVPKISSFERSCPGGQILIQGSGFEPNYLLQVREESGRLSPVLTGTIATTSRIELTEPLPRWADLLISDPNTRAYASLIAPGDPCDPEPEPPPLEEEDGCSCQSVSTKNAGGRHFPVDLPMIVLMALFAAFAARRARLILILAAAFFPADALAYKCSRVAANYGPSLYWNTRSIPWVAHSTLTTDLPNDVALEQLRLSFSAWEDVDCSDMTFPSMGQRAAIRAGFVDGGPNENVVVFIESAWPYDRGVIAVTTNAYETRSGLVLDSDIEINGEQFIFVVADASCRPNEGQMDLRNAITHEVGHVVGLDHPPLSPRYAETTMYASAPPCEVEKRTLAEDDIEGFCYIYPSAMDTVQCYPPDGPSFVVVEQDDGFGGCQSTRYSADNLAWIALIAFFVRRKK